MRSVLWAASLGVEMAAAVLVGAGIGYFIDSKLGSIPWGMVLGIILGALAGFLNIYKIMNYHEHS